MEKKALEEISVENEEQAKAEIDEAKMKLENLHIFADNLSTEVVNLKETIVKLNQERNQIHTELATSNKTLKIREKEIKNITKRFDNSQEAMKNLKSEKSSENAKAESEIKKLEKKLAKKVTTMKSVQTQTESSKIITPNLPSSSPETSSSMSSTCSNNNVKTKSSSPDFPIVEIENTEADKNQTPGERNFHCEKCGRKCVNSGDLQYHTELYHGKTLAEKILEKMKPQKTFYYPPVPTTLNLKALDKYEAIFGNHKCDDCQRIETVDCETKTPLQFLICQNNFLDLCDIMRYANTPSNE